MGSIYVRSSDGSDADNGSSWALAKATLSGAAAIDAAGDSIYLASTHSESPSSVNAAFAGTAVAPVRIWSVSDSAAPPTTLTAGAAVLATGGGITITGCVDVRGLTMETGYGADIALGPNGGDVQTLTDCTLRLVNSGGSGRILVNGVSSAGDVLWRRVAIRLGAALHSIALQGGRFRWVGGSVIAGSVTPTSNGLLSVGVTSSRAAPPALVAGVDLSGFAAGLALAALQLPGLVQFIGCKLPSGWIGPLYYGTRVPGARVEMFACDDGASVLRDQVAEPAGDLYTETTIKPAGVTKTWRMVSAANALTFDALPIKIPLAAGTHTIEIDVLTDGVTLTDADAWLEVQYAGSSANTLYSIASDAPSNPLSPSAQASSSTSWTTTGIAAPVKQKLGVTITVGQDCVAVATVRVARASATVFVSPVPTVS